MLKPKITLSLEYDPSLGVATFNKWQNPDNPTDVNANGVVTSLDATLVMDAIEKFDGGILPEAGPQTSEDFFFDVNGDGFVSANDALLVINSL